MEQYKTYKIDFTHLFTRSQHTVELAQSKNESTQMLKTLRSKFGLLWKRSKIYC